MQINKNWNELNWIENWKSSPRYRIGKAKARPINVTVRFHQINQNDMSVKICFHMKRSLTVLSDEFELPFDRIKYQITNWYEMTIPAIEIWRTTRTLWLFVKRLINSRERTSEMFASWNRMYAANLTDGRITQKDSHQSASSSVSPKWIVKQTSLYQAIFLCTPSSMGMRMRHRLLVT
jgi:hypothetical protein